MRSSHHYSFAALVFFLTLIYSSIAITQEDNSMTKLQYYTKLCKEKGEQVKIERSSGVLDRKECLFDYGNLRLGIQNTNLLGNSRQMITFEYPKGSGHTYNWCQSLLVGGILNDIKAIANGTLGCYSGLNEDHFEPLPGYDSGNSGDGIAMSNKPESWPASWPADAGPIGTGGFPGVHADGETAATAEAFWVCVDDDPTGKSPRPLHIKTYSRAMQWDNPLAEDFIIFKFLIENTGPDTIKDCFVTVHSDMDAPEEGNNEWEDDFAKFISIEEDTVLGNFLYVWDGDDKSEGYLDKNVAWQGLKVLETPLGPDGEEIGLTTMICDIYDNIYALSSFGPVYDFLTTGIDEVDNIEPHPDDWTQTPNTYGPDITAIIGSGPLNLAPGEKVTFTFANIFGDDKNDLMNNAAYCQGLFDKNYRIELVNIKTRSNVINKSFSLEQNYPNPFNPTTHITYHLAKSEFVELSIFNTLGQKISTLVNGRKNPGTYTIHWDGKNKNGEPVPSGLYLVKLQTDSYNDLKKMHLIR